MSAITVDINSSFTSQFVRSWIKQNEDEVNLAQPHISASRLGVITAVHISGTQFFFLSLHSLSQGTKREEKKGYKKRIYQMKGEIMKISILFYCFYYPPTLSFFLPFFGFTCLLIVLSFF